MTDALDPMEPHIETIRQHLLELFGGLSDDYPGGLVEIAWTDATGKLNRALMFGLDDLASAADFAGKVNAQGANVYVGVNPRKPGTKNARANGNDVELSCFNFVDIDDGESATALAERADKLPYTFVVTTGSVPSWRVHAYWRLEEGCRNLDAWGLQQRALAAHFGGDNVVDPPRVLRLAGTVNYPSEKKAGKGYVPELVRLNALYDGERRDPVSPQALSAAYPPAVKTQTPRDDIDFGATSGLDVQHCLAEIAAGNDLHNNARDLAAHLVARGYDDFFIEDYLTRVLEPVSDGGTIGEIGTLIKSAREKFDGDLQQKVAPASGAWPEPLAVEAFHGLPGEIVRIIAPHSEADPAALLIQVLVAAGSAMGRKPYFRAEADRHGTNLFAVLVGMTAKSRKGSSWGQVRRVIELVDEEWANTCVQSGLSSGEGLIWAVRDPVEKREAIKSKGRVVDYEMVETDPGVSDKRLLVYESEFASTLRVLGREGNTLSAVIRNAWDTGDLRTLTKNSPAQSTGAHISIIGHITKNELLRYLTETEAGNGFGNRILWVCTRRSKTLPDGGNLSDADLAPLASRLGSALAFAKEVDRMERDDEARLIWHAVYPELSEGKPGLLGAMIARAEAQVMRIACIYALLDESSVVRAEHLQAALAVWEYGEASARFIFGDSLGDPVADEILRALRQSPDGLTRTHIRDLFGRNKRSSEIGRALAVLIEHGTINYMAEVTEGRPAERYFASGAPA